MVTPHLPVAHANPCRRWQVLSILSANLFRPVDRWAAFISVPRILKDPVNDRRFEQKRPLQRPRGRGPLAEDLGRTGHFRHQERRPPREILRAGDVPISVGAYPYGPRA